MTEEAPAVYACKCVALLEQVQDTNPPSYAAESRHAYFEVTDKTLKRGKRPGSLLCSSQTATAFAANELGPGQLFDFLQKVASLKDGDNRECHTLIGFAVGEIHEQEIYRTCKKFVNIVKAMKARYDAGAITPTSAMIVPNNFTNDAAMAPYYLGLFQRHTDDVFLAINSVLQFQGFRPEVLLEKLVAAEPDPRLLRLDMMKCVVLALQRGTKLSKIAVRMTGDALAMVNELRMKYNIADSDRGNFNTITLARICVVFAAFVFQVLNKYKEIKPNVLAYLPEHFPKAYAFPGSGVLMKHYPELKMAHIVFQIEFTNMLSGTKIFDKNKILAQAKTNFSATHVDKTTSDQLMEVAGIADGAGLSASFVKMATDAYQALGLTPAELP